MASLANSAPQIMFGSVMHARLFPRKNAFRYGIYYTCLPLNKLETMPLNHNKTGLISIYNKDLGPCDGRAWDVWVRGVLADYKLCNITDGNITLVTMPRVMGYVFNPVSFWLCHDKEHKLRAVICEVHNTFGERHSYICAHEDHREIMPDDLLNGQKLFHVSPFIEREGRYVFRFDTRPESFGVWIDFYDKDGIKQLLTSLTGQCEDMTKATLRKAFWAYPLVTIKAITLIHWQALKLITKKIRYISKPKQLDETVSGTDNLKKM